MSATATHDHGVEALARADGDPTRSATLRRRYAQRLRGRLDELSAAIREGVADRDVLGLGTEALAPAPPQPPPPFPFATDDQKRAAFLRWLRRQERRGVLQVIRRDENVFVRSAYAKGLRHADAALNAEGVTVPDEELAAIFNTPVHRDALQTLYTRNFAALTDITDAMDRQISEELADGFSRGLGPRQMARNITDRVDKVGKHRATLLARTETIRAHSEATLNRYEQMNVGAVTVRAEWLTAGDNRVCPICSALEGTVYTVEEAREGTFDYTAGEDEPASLTGTYSVQPPAHPNCRCSLIPSVT